MKIKIPSVSVPRVPIWIVAIISFLMVLTAIILLSKTGNTDAPLWLIVLTSAICALIIGYVILKRLKPRGVNLPKLKFKAWVVWTMIIVILTLTLIFIPWRTWFPKKAKDLDWVSISEGLYRLSNTIKPKERLMFTIDEGWNYWYDPGRDTCITILANHDTSFRYHYCGGQYVEQRLGSIPGTYYVTAEQKTVVRIYKKKQVP